MDKQCNEKASKMIEAIADLRELTSATTVRMYQKDPKFFMDSVSGYVEIATNNPEAEKIVYDTMQMILKEISSSTSAREIKRIIEGAMEEVEGELIEKTLSDFFECACAKGDRD